MRLIDADALYVFIQDQMEKETGAYTRGKNKAFNIVKSALHNECATPTIEAEPVKHGRWVWTVESGWCCSSCNFNCWHYSERFDPYAPLPDADYCPNCGAKMDKGDE